MLGVHETKLQNNFRFSLKNILKDHFILLLNETLSQLIMVNIKKMFTKFTIDEYWIFLTRLPNKKKFHIDI